jgi:hypothetical protein
MFLADPQKVIAELYADNNAPAAVSMVLRRAAALGDSLRTGVGEQYEAIRDLVARVEIGDEAICIALKRRSVITQLDIPFDATALDADVTLELRLPAELRRLGKEKRLIVAALLRPSIANVSEGQQARAAAD